MRQRHGIIGSAGLLGVAAAATLVVAAGPKRKRKPVYATTRDPAAVEHKAMTRQQIRYQQRQSEKISKRDWRKKRS